MDSTRLNILSVSTRDRLGGAERIATDLDQAYRDRGHRSLLAVGQKRTDNPNVVVIPNHEADSRWARFWWWVHHGLQPIYGRFPGSRTACRLAHRLAQPRGLVDHFRGIEDFHYPGTWKLLDAAPWPPDVLQCHNLHSNYFDLSALPWLSHQLPVFLTCHDTWLLAGHCAYSLGCDRWETGCGQCPDLTLHPPIRRDASRRNWQRKRDIFAKCRLYIGGPSRWVVEQVEQSMLMPAIIEMRVIPNGIDLSVFKPAAKDQARDELGIAPETKLLVFAANGIRANAFKDYQTLRAALGYASSQMEGQSVTLIAVGEAAPGERIGNAQVRFVPFQNDPRAVARYYQAADLYVHAAHGETWGLTVTESLACGTPVVATCVGGIPDQIKPLAPSPVCCSHETSCNADESATGILVGSGDSKAMADAIVRLLSDQDLLQRMGTNAAQDARARFGLQRQADAYLDWFHEVLAERENPREETPPHTCGKFAAALTS